MRCCRVLGGCGHREDQLLAACRRFRAICRGQAGRDVAGLTLVSIIARAIGMLESFWLVLL
jgi:hypothetical protein